MTKKINVIHMRKFNKKTLEEFKGKYDINVN